MRDFPVARHLAASAAVLAGSVAASVLLWIVVFTVVPYFSSTIDYPLGPAILFASLGSLFLAVVTLTPGVVVQWIFTVLVGLKRASWALHGGAILGCGASLAVVYAITAPSADLRTAVWFGSFTVLQALALFWISRYKLGIR